MRTIDYQNLDIKSLIKNRFDYLNNIIKKIGKMKILYFILAYIENFEQQFYLQFWNKKYNEKQ